MNTHLATFAIALYALVVIADSSPDHGWVSKAPVDVSSIPVAKSIVPRKIATKSLRRLSASSATLELGLPPDTDGRIAECARGLRHDWQRCFDFVRDNIAFSPCAGILRGPVRTLVDREGSDADQALLLMALLKASGYADMKLVYEPATLSNGNLESGFKISLDAVSGYSAIAWLGLPTNVVTDAIGESARYRLTNGGHETIGYTYNGIHFVVTDHYWVELTVDGVKHSLDPSFKPSPGKTMPDVLAQMKYNRASLLSSVGGSVDASSVKNLSEGNLTAALKGYAKNLSEAWTNANWSAEDYLGIGVIVPRGDSDSYFPGTSISGSPIDVFGQDANSVNARRARADLTLDGTPLVSFYLDEIGLRNLWLSYEQNGSALQTVLHLDDQVLKTVSAASSGKATLRIAVDYAHGETTKDYSFSRKAGNAYSVIVGFGSDARGGMRKFATGELARLKNAGHADDSRRMLAAMTYSAGHHWMAECAAIQKIRNCVLGGDEGMYYDVGISGQDGGPYVDMANRMGFGQKNITHFNGSGFFDSALEHSILEQLNGPGSAAVSTVKILSLANASGNPVYFMNSGNASSVISSLQNYSESTLSAFRSEVAENKIILAPKNAKTALNQWSGTGYVTFGPLTDGTTRVNTGMIISGGYNGGYDSEEEYPDYRKWIRDALADVNYGHSGPWAVQGDPIAMPHGNFLDRKQDLALNRATPLSWTRRYDSSESYFDGVLGRGWSHNFDARIIHMTDFDSFFGRGSVKAVMPSVVAAAVVDDLLKEQKSLSSGENARRFMLAALAINWWANELRSTAITIKLGSMMLGFTRNPDGTYAPAPGVTAELTRGSDIFTLQERNGSKYVFNEDGLLSSCVDVSGNTTRLTYANGKLTKVENDFDASLTVNWTGERISSVSDNAGRSVSYTYDSNGCLVKTIDSNGKVWTSTYDAQSHALLTKTNPDGQRIIKNTYNEYWQVTNQVSDIGQTWEFGYASYCEAWDRNPLGDYLAKKYDHCGRVYLQMDRDGAETHYSYDG